MGRRTRPGIPHYGRGIRHLRRSKARAPRGGRRRGDDLCVRVRHPSDQAVQSGWRLLGRARRECSQSGGRDGGGTGSDGDADACGWNEEQKEKT